MRVRLVTALFVTPVALAACFVLSSKPSAAVAGGPSCGQKVVKDPTGVSIEILFAKNGAVQRYVVLHSEQGDMEAVNDLRLALQKQYGPADIDAPPLRIVSFKPGSGGMNIPDKAIDSCGRTISFQ